MSPPRRNRRRQQARQNLPAVAQNMGAGPPGFVACAQQQQQQQHRFRVEVRLHQDTGHVIAGAGVVIDGAGAVASDNNGRTPWVVHPANTPHNVSVEYPAAPVNGLYAECTCPACQAGTPVRYWPWDVVEYLQQPTGPGDTTLTVYVDQVRRIRLGYPNDVSVPGPTTVDRTWVYFYTPETKGVGPGQGTGHTTRIGMHTDLGTLEYFDMDPTVPAVQTSANVSVITGPQAGGWRYARLFHNGAGPAHVSASMEERGYARDQAAKTSPPLLPWTFYFWPTAAGNGPNQNTTSRVPQAANTIFSPLYAYDNWMGRNPNAAGSAFHWECDPANLHCNTAGAWSGHCNQAATASIIFEEPAANVDWQWQSADAPPLQLQLDSEGLKLLATEFAGHRVVTETLLTTHANLVPPNPTPADLAKYCQGLNSFDANTSRWPSADSRLYAAKMFNCLQTYLGDGGEPLLTDVRAPVNNVAENHAQVWNQAIYLYDMLYYEHPAANPAESEERRGQDLLVTTNVYWNEDFLGTYGPNTQTATVVDNGGGDFTVTPRNADRRGMSLWRQMNLRLQFTNAGQLDEASDRNAIETSIGANGTAFYLLRYLQRVTQVTNAVQSNQGNPGVATEIFNLTDNGGAPVLSLRARYPLV